MKLCATALRREMRLPAAEKGFPAPPLPIRVERGSITPCFTLQCFFFCFFYAQDSRRAGSHDSPSEIIFKFLEYDLLFKAFESLLLKLLPFLVFVFQREKLRLRGRKQHGAEVAATAGEVPVFCVTRQGLF